MEEQEARARFKENVEWLKVNIDEDDIYDFAEQTLMAADFFMGKWAKEAGEEAVYCPQTEKWIKNVLSIRAAKCEEIKRQISTKMKMV